MKCTQCGKEKELSDFYFFVKKNEYSNICLKCQRINYLKKRENENGFVNKVMQEPRAFFDEKQKQQTFEFMQMLGWTYNQEKDIWYKSGIVDENGVWLGLIGYNKDERTKRKEEEKLERWKKSKRDYAKKRREKDRKKNINIVPPRKILTQKFCKMCGEFRPIEEFYLYNGYYSTLCNNHTSVVKKNRRNKL